MIPFYLAAILCPISLFASYLTIPYCILLVTIILFILGLTFYDLYPKQWDGSSLGPEIEHPWKTRVLIIAAAAFSIFSNFIGHEYGVSWISHSVCGIYPIACVLGIVGIQLQSEALTAANAANSHVQYQRIRNVGD